MSMKAKVAIVTGASGGIGLAVAKALAKEGVKVGLGARRETELQEAVKAIKEKGGEAIAVKTDVTKREQVKNLAAETKAAFGPIDILVNNAGIFFHSPMKDLDEDAWEKIVDVNVKGFLNGIGAVLDDMVKRKTGHIVNISSDSARKPFPGMAVYGGSKYFVEGMSGCMRQELAQYGIRVTNVLPGDVDTPGSKDFFANQKTSGIEGGYTLPPDTKILTEEDVSRAVMYALSQPEHVAVNEVLIQPQATPL